MDWAKRDKALRPKIERVWEQNYKVYGVRKVWHKMRREGFDVARCTGGTADERHGTGKRHSWQESEDYNALPCPRRVNRQFKAEGFHHHGPLRSFDAVEYASLEWIGWSNNLCRLESIGNILPAEGEANFYAPLERSDIAA